MNNSPLDTDELSFVVNNVNPTNVDVYREIYGISVDVRSSFINNRVVALLGVCEDYDPAFVALHINTIFLEFLRNELMDLGIIMDSSINLFESLSIYNKLKEITDSPDLVSCLQEVPVSSCDLLDVANKLGVDLSLEIMNIFDSSLYIQKLYRDNKEFIYRDISEPIDLPDIP